MASIELTPRELIVRLHGVDRFLALRSSVSVPLAHVAGVRERAEEANFDDAVRDSGRGIGTFLRGRIAAGILNLPDGRSFYDVRDPRAAIVVDLRSEPFAHLVVQVAGESAAAAACRIREALDRRVARGEGRPQAPAHHEDAVIPVLHESYGLPMWKSALAIATGIAFAPVAALAFVFLAPALLPLLVLGLSRPGVGGASRAFGAADRRALGS
ncbi:MAG TPA: hypothetical protein VF765_21075 [Polyangiaceae bacterium]